jgi:hypothetical protein
MTAQTLVDTPEGPQSVTLRRTVIDEVQFPDKPTQQ